MKENFKNQLSHIKTQLYVAIVSSENGKASGKAFMSASHEKSPTEKHTHTQDSTPQQQKPSFVCDRGASLCNPGLLAGEFNVSIQK